MLNEFQRLFGGPTYSNSQKGRQSDFEIQMDLNGKIPLCSPYRISPHQEDVIKKQIDKAMRCGWIQPSRCNFGSPVLFVPKPDSIMGMCIDYCAVHAIIVKDRNPLCLFEDLLNSMHCSCWFPKLELVASYHQISMTAADRQKAALTTKFSLYEWQVLPFALANALWQFMCMMNGILEPMKCKFIVVYLDNNMIRS
jgi:hypothetical protein